MNTHTRPSRTSTDKAVRTGMLPAGGARGSRAGAWRLTGAVGATAGAALSCGAVGSGVRSANGSAGTRCG